MPYRCFCCVNSVVYIQTVKVLYWSIANTNMTCSNVTAQTLGDLLDMTMDHVFHILKPFIKSCCYRVKSFSVKLCTYMHTYVHIP